MWTWFIAREDWKLTPERLACFANLSPVGRRLLLVMPEERVTVDA